MIVFYYLISFIVISIIVLAFSSVKIEIEKIKIADARAGNTIISDILKSRYENIIDNIEILLKLKINIFNILPISILKIDNKNLKSMIEKSKGKIKITPKNKQTGKAIGISLINNKVLIENININISLGLNNAHHTALTSTLFTIIIAIALNFITDNRIKIYKNEHKQEKYLERNFKYKVNPVYSDDIVFNCMIKLKVTLKIISIIKEILMYKYNLFVNNTNKYKVKES